MNWNDQIAESLIWLIEAFLISGLGFVALLLWFLKGTLAGKEFWRVTGGYFSWQRSIKPFAMLAILILLALASVRLSVLLSEARSGYYSALQEFNAQAFWLHFGAWSIIIAGIVTRAVIYYYFKMSLTIDWRSWLTQNFMEKWLAHQNYFRSQYASQKMDNPDQRIQEDISAFISTSLSLSVGLLDAGVSLFEFSIMLWALSGALNLFGLEIPRAMFIFAYTYVVLATVTAIWLGRPLIQLSFANEKLNANFRYALIRLKEYSESIAFFRGEKVERHILFERFSRVISNAWATTFRTLKFDGFNTFVTYASIGFPLLFQAPRVLAKEIKLGDMAQTINAFSEVEASLSYLRNSFESIAGYRAMMLRLIGYLDVIQESENIGRLNPVLLGNRFEIQNLDVRSPTGSLIIENLGLTLDNKDALLIQGPSGVGKTTLLRAIAGLWPYAQGEVILPEHASSFFLPQKPYLPLGTLAQALAYPNSDYDPAQLSEVLAQVQLSHLQSRLNDDADWTQVLSLGEQQRLAMGRVLLAKPQIIFLDEASSAMDEGLEFAMYQLIKTRLPDSIFISVGHRSSLLNFHSHTLRLEGQGRWALGTTA